jgi:hypothetical protein
VHLHLDVAALLRMSTDMVSQIVASDFGRNPWQPTQAPELHLLPA